MQSTAFQYPVFEANQVLTNEHLNQLFVYLEEQERLTRANLLGIGVVCGLELILENTTAGPKLHISKGCGITSEGYLLVKTEEVRFGAYRDYTPPKDIDYPLFSSNKIKELLKTNPIRELLPDGTPASTTLNNTFLQNKVVVAFLELLKEDLRNCSTVDCNDKGSTVKTALRYLLIDKLVLDQIVSNANTEANGANSKDQEAQLLERLNLPDLRLPRFDVPSTNLVNSNDVYTAFFNVFQSKGRALFTKLHQAFSAAYSVFKPILGNLYPNNTDPFSAFKKSFEFLDVAPSTVDQVKFIQYYYDLFDDLIKAYDEFRWKGADLFCACCPSEKLFPRHLMLGLAVRTGGPSLGHEPYRNHFLPSAAVGNCEQESKELKILFQRLVEMTQRFTSRQALIKKVNTTRDLQIRITPSKLGEVPLSEKAIPYYYSQSGTQPLYQLWSPEKRRLGRSNQNLGYDATSYTPAAPEFVTKPLEYDLEPYNFLRIEGHLSKQYKDVLKELLLLKAEHRLPFEVIALRTGVFDSRQTIDPDRDKARFQDLEAMYAAIRESLLCKWCKSLEFVYNIVDKVEPQKMATNRSSSIKLFEACNEQKFQIADASYGAYYEQKILPNISKGYASPNLDRGGFDSYLINLTTLLVKFSEELPTQISSIVIANLKTRFKDLIATASKLLTAPMPQIPPYAFDDEQFRSVLTGIIEECHLDPFEVIQLEYQKRLNEARKMQFLSNFLQQHPGIQHKAGVPMGGTFILVYHEDPAPIKEDTTLSFNSDLFFADTLSSLEKFDFDLAFNTLAADPVVSKSDSFSVISQILNKRATFTNPTVVAKRDLDALKVMVAKTVEELADGEIIADFYLPYTFNDLGSGMQFVLPPPPVLFTLKAMCTNENDIADVKINLESGVKPLSVKINNAQDYIQVKEDDTIQLRAGSNKVIVRDAAGAVSVEQTIEVPEAIKFNNVEYRYAADGKYFVEFEVSGGAGTKEIVDPQDERVSMSNNKVIAKSFEKGEDYAVKIKDSVGCTKTLQFKPIDVSVTLTCTTMIEGKAVSVATLTVGDGQAPYSYQLGVDGAFQALSEEKSIINIEKTITSITIKDKSGHKTTQSLAIPDVLSFSLPVYTAQEDGYEATFTIHGGTPLFTTSANNGLVINDRIGKAKLPNSTRNQVFKITDAKGCILDVTLQAPKPVLPCKGASTRCAYRLWLQPPSDNFRYTSLDYKGPLSFFYQEKPISLSTSINKIFGEIPIDDLNNDFHGVMAAVIERLNRFINQTLNRQFGSIGMDRLSITYQDESDYPFAALKIESFDCESFAFGFNFAFSTGNFLESSQFEVSYSNVKEKHGFTIVDELSSDEKGDLIPAFDCAKRNRNVTSGAEADFIRSCQDPISLRLSTIRLNPDSPGGPGDEVVVLPRPGTTIGARPNFVQIIGETDREAEIIAWIWDFPGNSPVAPQVAKKSISVGLDNQNDSMKLTVISRNGCFGSVTKKID